MFLNHQTIDIVTSHSPSKSQVIFKPVSYHYPFEKQRQTLGMIFELLKKDLIQHWQTKLPRILSLLSRPTHTIQTELEGMKL